MKGFPGLLFNFLPGRNWSVEGVMWAQVGEGKIEGGLCPESRSRQCEELLLILPMTVLLKALPDLGGFSDSGGARESQGMKVPGGSPF